MTIEHTGSPKMTSDIGNRSFSILVIEDVRMIYDVIERTLSDLDVDYVFAQDGLAAIEDLEDPTKAVPDLIILDLALPLVDGWEVLRRVRADTRTQNVPVLIITAHGQSGLERELMSLGAKAFLDKPFRPKALRAAVYELLGVEAPQ